jgi:hypothetical protein
MDKEEFHLLFGVVQGWFSAKLGSKISDGSQLSAQFLWPPTATETIKQTALYGQGRVSFGLWCQAGLVFSKTWAIKISDVYPSCQHNLLGHQQQPQGHNKQESTTSILPYGSNKQHCMDKEEFHWVCGVV